MDECMSATMLVNFRSATPMYDTEIHGAPINIWGSFTVKEPKFEFILQVPTWRKAMRAARIIKAKYGVKIVQMHRHNPDSIILPYLSTMELAGKPTLPDTD